MPKVNTSAPTSRVAFDAVASLDLLLTGGRLHSANQQYILHTLEEELRKGVPLTEVMRTAVELFSLTPEFHSTAFNARRNVTRAKPPMPPPAPPGRGYKALVYLYFDGGADTYSHLIPLSGCGAVDLHAQYLEFKGPLAYNASVVHPINATSAQPCARFGLHPEYNFTAG